MRRYAIVTAVSDRYTHHLTERQKYSFASMEYVDMVVGAVAQVPFPTFLFTPPGNTTDIGADEGVLWTFQNPMTVTCIAGKSNIHPQSP